MNAMDLYELLMILFSFSIIGWVIIGLYKMNKHTTALVRDLDRAWGIDNGEECK